MTDEPIVLILDIKPTIKTVKVNKSELKLDVLKSIRILNNVINDTTEIYYNTNNKNEIEILLNLLDNQRTVNIFYRKYVTEPYTYIGDLSELSLIEYKNINDDYKYFNILINKTCDYKLPHFKISYKYDIIKYLKYTLSNKQIEFLNKENIIDLKDLLLL